MPKLIYKNIVHKAGLTTFRLEPLSVEKEWVYAVYCEYKGKAECFHMIRNKYSQAYEIMDRQNCPYDLLALAPVLSDAIMEIRTEA